MVELPKVDQKPLRELKKKSDAQLYGVDEKLLEKARAGGWVGVDLDGTMFVYTEWVGWNVFGKPIPLMIERVRAWLEAGIDVRIVTARVGLPIMMIKQGRLDSPIVNRAKINTCRVTGALFSDGMMITAIQDHCERHGLPRLPVQCHKDVNMIELWDDRAVQVVANTGRTLAEEHEAQITALRGAAFSSLRVSDDCAECGGGPCRRRPRHGDGAQL